MKYLLLIYYDEQAVEKAGKELTSQIERECIEQSEPLKAKGIYLGGNRLYPTSTATSIRQKDGKRIVTDGPFAETREQLGGFTLINAQDLDEAIRIASEWPPGKLGTVEIRPVMEFADARSPS